jgi:AraC family transcriptional activator of pobA
MEDSHNIKFSDFLKANLINTDLSKGLIGDADFCFVNSKILHPKHTLPWSSPLCYPNFFSIGFVIDARGVIIVDSEKCIIKPRMLFIIRPGELQQLKWDEITESYGLWFTENFINEYAGISIYETFSFMLFERHIPLHTSIEFQQELIKVIMQIVQELQKDSVLKKKICANLLTRFLLKIKQEYWEGYMIQTAQTRNPDIVKDFMQNLEYHYDQLLKGKVNIVLRIRDYAEMQRLHKNYLSNVLKEKTGKTGSQLIADKTLSLAKILMKDSRLSVKEIAYTLGFSYLSYFNIFFKKHTGQSPGNYRKKSLNYNTDNSLN